MEPYNEYSQARFDRTIQTVEMINGKPYVRVFSYMGVKPYVAYCTETHVNFQSTGSYENKSAGGANRTSYIGYDAKIDKGLIISINDFSLSGKAQFMVLIPTVLSDNLEVFGGREYRELLSLIP